MYDYEEFDDMAKRDKDLILYSQSNVIASYINMIKFAIEQIELRVDEIGDGVYFDGDTSPFPPDVLGDDSLFGGYTNPWSPDDECKCDECCCGNDKDGNRANRPESKKEYFDWVGNALRQTRRQPPRGMRID